ncbi:MAG TPA: YggT family protein [Candidatus Binataceae bacterium]|nr:YggT family protein [Candidatus Binataceae bacterium]
MFAPSLADTIAGILIQLLRVYSWVVIIAAVMTWINPDPYNPIVRFFYGVTEPVFDLVREYLPVNFGGVDLSPIVVLILIEIMQQWLIPNIALTLDRALA